MISKKDALTLVVLGVGGVAVASAFADGDSGDGGGAVMEGLRGVKGRAGGILGGATPSPTVYQFAAQPAVRFPAAPGFDMSRLFPSEKLAAPAPVERGAAGVSSAGKKISKGAGMALGYTGYVTPTVPTPVSPGYIAGVTKFVPYKEPTYIPSPVAPPYVAKSGGGGTTKKKATPKKKYVRRSKTGYTYKGGKLSKK